MTLTALDLTALKLLEAFAQLGEKGDPLLRYKALSPAVEGFAVAAEPGVEEQLADALQRGLDALLRRWASTSVDFTEAVPVCVLLGVEPYQTPPEVLARRADHRRWRERQRRLRRR